MASSDPATRKAEQPKTRVVHCKVHSYDVYIGRPSQWGNPFTHKKGTLAQFQVATRHEAIEKYRAYILQRLEKEPSLREDLRRLKGKVLGCHCKPLPCHGDVLAELADAMEPSEHDLPPGRVPFEINE